jgi:hypothetical protein
LKINTNECAKISFFPKEQDGPLNYNAYGSEKEISFQTPCPESISTSRDICQQQIAYSSFHAVSLQLSGMDKFKPILPLSNMRTRKLG